MNKLEHKNEFEKILKNYEISDEAQQILGKTKLVLFLAPSSTGRDTIIRNLLKDDKYYSVVSDTTRSPRENDGVMEKDGVEYNFKTEAEFLKGLKDGMYLEAELIHKQQVSGISIKELQKLNKLGSVGLKDIDLGGAKKILQAKPDCKVILLLPPHFDEWQKRVVIRGAMDKNEWKRRMQTAVKIFQEALNLTDYKIVINDDLREAVDQCKNIIENQNYDESEQKHGQKIAEDLLKHTEKYLKSHKT